ncbi:hypothetical protein K0M31_017373 [Melipona bicolor]|uniref:Uncharacterized protein n=1 Tax=Melipona bicolor TaxID=60889 RepID=A0AA40G4Y7_9HYME|nr:hypothetical protein K0M31_017373 [Melipona bicolor]
MPSSRSFSRGLRSNGQSVRLFLAILRGNVWRSIDRSVDRSRREPSVQAAKSNSNHIETTKLLNGSSQSVARFNHESKFEISIVDENENVREREREHRIDASCIISPQKSPKKETKDE